MLYRLILEFHQDVDTPEAREEAIGAWEPFASLIPAAGKGRIYIIADDHVTIPGIDLGRDARKIQQKRFRKSPRKYCNDQMTPREIEIHCGLGQESRDCIDNAMRTMKLSARAYHRILKVARTIADLEGEPEISAGHISEAANYRSLDRDYWSGL